MTSLTLASVSTGSGLQCGVDLRRHRAGLRVDGTRIPGQILLRLAVRTDDELALQPAGYQRRQAGLRLRLRLR